MAIKHNRALHERLFVLTVTTESMPRVRDTERLSLEEIAPRFWRAAAHYGFMERPDIPALLHAAHGRGCGIGLSDVTYYVGHETVVHADDERALPRWVEAVFAVMQRNSAHLTDYFRLPVEAVVEIGRGRAGIPRRRAVCLPASEGVGPRVRIRLAPAGSLVRTSDLGMTLMYQGQPEAAISHIEKAIRLNPHDPNIANYYLPLGQCHLFLGHVDQAIDLLRKARAANPRLYYLHLHLAGALGIKGDLDEARTALAEGMKLKPEIDSLIRWRALFPWGNPKYWALIETTIAAGLRRAGLSEE